MSQPLISIITATYNRSNVLKYAIKSILGQTYSNWEHLIIGDACTDDTGEVVNSFSDDRIKFVNLQENFGEQSGPNNYGLNISKGDYITYLNHDDMWFEDHLEKALAAIRRTGADFISNLVCAIDHHDRPNLIGVSNSPEPFYWTPASGWLFRRGLAEQVGQWKFYRNCYAIPSHDWLFRVWKAGKKIYLNPELTVIAIQSGRRQGSYAKREFLINQRYNDRLKEPGFRERVLTGLALEYISVNRYPKFIPVVKRVVKNLVIKLLYKLGANPYAFLYFLLYRKKGGYIDYLRQNRGLRKLQ